MLFGTWLAETAELQRLSYGRDIDEMEFESWITYVREQTLAAFVELGEFIQKLRWKPWGKVKSPPDDWEREEIIEEIVDVLHFIANDLYALGVSDEELSTAYKKKMDKNRERMAAGGH